jgi:hypothetical protein
MVTGELSCAQRSGLGAQGGGAEYDLRCERSLTRQCAPHTGLEQVEEHSRATAEHHVTGFEDSHQSRHACADVAAEIVEQRGGSGVSGTGGACDEVWIRSQLAD